MSLYGYWEEGKKEILAAKAMTHLPEWKKEKYTCTDCKEILTPTIDFGRTRNGNQEYVVAHFKHNKESTCPLANGESNEHKERKGKLLSYLFGEKIKLNIYGMEYLIKKENVKDIEVTRKENRADVFIEFKEYNPIFGNGICFEIMESETYDSIEIKKEQWLSKGYTLIEIPKNTDFDKIFIEGFKIKETHLKKLIDSLNDKQKELLILIKRIEDFKLPSHQEILISETKNNCSNCFYSTQDKDIHGIKVPDRFACWLWNNKGLQKRPDKMDKNQICNFYKGSDQK